jgi:hypothetical protein
MARLEGSTTTRRVDRSLGIHGLRPVLVLRHRLRQPFPHSLHLPARKNVIDNHETRLGLTRVPAAVVGLGFLRQHATFDDAEKIQKKIKNLKSKIYSNDTHGKSS